jgi:hypothetical protein
MPYDTHTLGADDEIVAAFRAANPGADHPSKKALREFLSRDFDAIMAKLDVSIAESHERLDEFMSALARAPN